MEMMGISEDIMDIIEEKDRLIRKKSSKPRIDTQNDNYNDLNKSHKTPRGISLFIDNLDYHYFSIFSVTN